jgi:hypothetical protein
MSPDVLAIDSDDLAAISTEHLRITQYPVMILVLPAHVVGDRQDVGWVKAKPPAVGFR